jgi:RimJ/RimL family protein N-acetyltransferase/ADP-ribose pyrophosphatase YjhB (NUDIX family)
MQQLGTKTIETHRLILRPFRAGDAPAMFRNWASDPVVTEYLTWAPHDSEQTTAGLVVNWAKETEETPLFFQWAIELKSIREPIGSISAMHVDERVESAELGWCIGKDWWGQGIMPEAGAAVIAYLIDEVGLNRVAARHDVRNPKSGRVMQKLGMTFEGVMRQAGVSNAGIGDIAVYSILRSEYLARGGALIPEKSCGAVIFAERDRERLYLLERMRKGHISLCKGHVEGSETERETAVREIREETALDVAFVDGFRESIAYSPYPGCEKTVVFFLARAARTETAAQPEEVSEILWLPEVDALKTLTFESDQEVLRKAGKFLRLRDSAKGV